MKYYVAIMDFTDADMMIEDFHFIIKSDKNIVNLPILKIKSDKKSSELSDKIKECFKDDFSKLTLKNITVENTGDYFSTYIITTKESSHEIRVDVIEAKVY